MNMTPRLQKLALLAHIAFSVGWFGAVIPYLALVIAGLTSRDDQFVRSAYPAMELIGWYVLVPLSFATLASGLVQSLFTQWGLIRHWWILAKLALTIFAVVILFQHMRGLSRMARMAHEMTLSSGDFRHDLIHATGGLLVLFAAMTLSMFKPWGMTPYGRKVSPTRSSADVVAASESAVATDRPRWVCMAGMGFALIVVIALLVVAVLHVSGMLHSGMHHSNASDAGMHDSNMRHH
jgi:hypothetical protein